MNTNKNTTFDLWHNELEFLAGGIDASYLLGDAESHRDAYNDGLSPEEDLGEQLAAAKAFTDMSLARLARS